jgi:hypothetical protein
VNLVAPTAPSGTAREGSRLTVVAGSWDTPATTTYIYTWYRCDAAATVITDACERATVGTTHMLGAADVGKRLGVRIGATSAGGDTILDTPLSAVIGGLALASVTGPSISGNAYVGESLIADAGSWTFPLPSFDYDWRRCAADGVSGCVSVGDGSPRYPVTGDDVGSTIVLVIAATQGQQHATASSAPLAISARPVPGATVAPVVSGVARRGQTLTATQGTWTNSPTGHAFQWQRCNGSECGDIAGANTDSYLLTPTDIGFTVRVVVTASNAVGPGSAASTESAVVVPGPPVNTHVPVITSPSPIVQQGVTLSVGGYTWEATRDTVYSLSWERCDVNGCAPIPGATGDRYLLVAADIGARIVAVSTASNPDGTVTARSAETVAATLAGPRWKTLPTIAGASAKVGDDVTMTPGTWAGGPPVVSDTTEMMRCTNVCVSRGTSSPYTIAAGDLGAILRVRETAANTGGTTIVWSAKYVGPVVSNLAGSLTLSSREAPVRNADGTTLAFARMSGGATAAAAAAKPKRATGPKVALRRPAKVKGKLVAWACPIASEAGATPAPCSSKVTLKKKATLKLPAGTAGKVRLVVVKAR